MLFAKKKPLFWIICKEKTAFLRKKGAFSGEKFHFLT